MNNTMKRFITILCLLIIFITSNFEMVQASIFDIDKNNTMGISKYQIEDGLSTFYDKYSKFELKYTRKDSYGSFKGKFIVDATNKAITLKGTVKYKQNRKTKKVYVNLTRDLRDSIVINNLNNDNVIVERYKNQLYSEWEADNTSTSSDIMLNFFRLYDLDASDVISNNKYIYIVYDSIHGKVAVKIKTKGFILKGIYAKLYDGSFKIELTKVFK